MSNRPKRQIKPVQRYEPEEIPNDDYDDDEEVNDSEVVKRLKGEFDELDDEQVKHTHTPISILYPLI